VSQIQDSLGNLKLDKDNLTFNGDISSHCASNGSLSTMVPTGDGALKNSVSWIAANTFPAAFDKKTTWLSEWLMLSKFRSSASMPLDDPAEPTHQTPRHESDAIRRLMVPDGSETSPVIVVSSQSQSPIPFASQLQPGVQNFIDAPDSRLIDALENPRDRLFVIKLEQDVIDFIEKNK
jgi:hypothetical protein